MAGHMLSRLEQKIIAVQFLSPSLFLTLLNSIAMPDNENSNPEFENHKRKIKIMEIVIFMFLVMLFMVAIIIIWTK